MFVASEAGEWLRMHSLARDLLRRRFADLPVAEQAELHERASAWLAEHGLLEAAATHALAAGQHEQAYELAERSLYESVMARGRAGAMLEWLERLPGGELDRRPRLLLAAAWSLALGERHEQAGRMVARILERPDADEALRCECALVLAGAAVFADEPDRFAELHDPWADDRRAAPEGIDPRGGRAAASGPGGSSWPPLRDPRLLQIHANRTAFRALLEGEPALARLRQQQAPRGHVGSVSEYIGHWGEFVTGLSYLWEGQVLLAESLLRPTLARAEVDLGRRNPFACMLAALLAAAIGNATAPTTRRRCSPIGSTSSSTAACPRPCCSPTGRWHASRSPKVPSTGASSCLAPWMPSDRTAAAAPAHREPCRPGAHARAPISRRHLPRAVQPDRRLAGR